jgi:TPR repeat protein
VTKLGALILFSILGGCTQQIHVAVSPDSMTSIVPKAVAEQYKESPLSQYQWALLKALQFVPVFETGTGIDEVRGELLEQNIAILREWPGFIVVRSGIGLHVVNGNERRNYLYGFENDTLVVGPLLYEQAQRQFLSQGLTSGDVETLGMFAGAEPLDVVAGNEFAWMLATYPDLALRKPFLAIEYSIRMNEASNWEEWSYVDTLAAAYASADKFTEAVKYQRQAIAMNYESDSEMAVRLKLYLNGESYSSQLSEPDFNERDTHESDPQPKVKLLLDATAGSPEAQFDLAAFYLGQNIRASDGIDNPGVFWLRQAAEQGHIYAANEMGWCLLMARCGLAYNGPEAARWFGIAVEKGDTTAAYNLGRMLANGQGIARDETRATRLLAQAADQGIYAAAFAVAFRYAEGLGAAPDFASKRRYIRQIEVANYGPADFLLDDAFFQNHMGGGIISAILERTAVRPEETADVLMVLVRAFEEASTDDGESFMVQLIDDTVFEYPADFGPALLFNLSRIAASLGSSSAQLKFAELYERGEGTPRSLAESHYWKQRAAK